MTAVVYPDSNGFHVSLRVADEEVDSAGPFDDVTEAILMADRWADSTELSDGICVGASDGTTHNVFFVL